MICLLERMPSALVLLMCESGCEHSVAENISRIPGVVDTNIVFGGYDIVAKVRADKMEKLKEIVGWEIKKLKGVKTSLTLIRHETR